MQVFTTTGNLDRINLKSLVEVADSATMRNRYTLRNYLSDKMGRRVTSQELERALFTSGRAVQGETNWFGRVLEWLKVWFTK